jgi:hypothetical protein
MPNETKILLESVSSGGSFGSQVWESENTAIMQVDTVATVLDST